MLSGAHVRRANTAIIIFYATHNSHKAVFIEAHVSYALEIICLYGLMSITVLCIHQIKLIEIKYRRMCRVTKRENSECEVDCYVFCKQVIFIPGATVYLVHSCWYRILYRVSDDGACAACRSVWSRLICPLKLFLDRFAFVYFKASRRRRVNRRIVETLNTRCYCFGVNDIPYKWRINFTMDYSLIDV